MTTKNDTIEKLFAPNRISTITNKPITATILRYRPYWKLSQLPSRYRVGQLYKTRFMDEPAYVAHVQRVYVENLTDEQVRRLGRSNLASLVTYYWLNLLPKHYQHIYYAWENAHTYKDYVLDDVVDVFKMSIPKQMRQALYVQLEV